MVAQSLQNALDTLQHLNLVRREGFNLFTVGNGDKVPNYEGSSGEGFSRHDARLARWQEFWELKKRSPPDKD